MTNQQKEGVIITVISIIMAGTACFFSDWSSTYPFEMSMVGPKWISYEVTFEYGTYTRYLTHVYLSNVIYTFAVPFIYGVLRATNILKRLFKIEEHLSKLIPTDSQN